MLLIVFLFVSIMPILCVMHNVLYVHVLLEAEGKYTYGTLNLTPAESIGTPVVSSVIGRFWACHRYWCSASDVRCSKLINNSYYTFLIWVTFISYGWMTETYSTSIWIDWKKTFFVSQATEMYPIPATVICCRSVTLLEYVDTTNWTAASLTWARQKECQDQLPVAVEWWRSSIELLVS